MQPEEAFDIAVVGLSARALVTAARRAGLRALALDLFADADTERLAAGSVRLASGRGLTIAADDLFAQLDQHIGPNTPVVLSSGFEHRPRLVERLAGRFPLMGSDARTLRRLKQPRAFAALLGELGIPHPRLFEEEAPPGVPALAKRIGGAGGQHIRPARRVRGRKRYLQERLEGRAVSALFLGDGRSARLIGFSEQWCDPAPHAPFRYGGAAGPIRLDAAMEHAIADAIGRLTRATGLVGLASADLMVNGANWHLIEVNPRPGASLDVFDHPPLPPLLRLHLDACAGRLPPTLDIAPSPRAAGLLYAPAAFTLGDVPLPEWVADRPRPGTPFSPGDPVCTVLADGESAAQARAAVHERAHRLIGQLVPAGGTAT
ncbi:ATP-grasp domain-containing protein [Ancylobacter sp. G4_0304]|uniref:ATP-grasp domain-containing protein n=1 Tax=Ancylobacter sp. G4_0304 TaxID=3114289 RepID=UPI0039C5C214